MKKFLILIVLIFSLAFIVGCGYPNYSIELEKAEYFVEYGEEFNVPDYVLKDSGGNKVDGDVVIKAYDQENNELAVNYGIVYFPIGENKLTFSIGKTTKTVKVICADTLAPTLTINNFVFTAFVGDTYTIPIYKASDISGINTSKTTVGLYKGNETQPVVTGVGSKASIENVDKYILKIYLEDKLGNGKTYEREIKVIDPFIDENVSDELRSKIMFDFDESEYIRNIVPTIENGFDAEITSSFPENNEGNGLGGSGSVLKLTHTSGDVNYVYIYKGKPFEKANTFSVKFRIYAASDKISVIRLRSIVNGAVIRVFDNATNFSANKWIDLETKATIFDTDIVDSLYLEVFGEEGAVLYIDKITYIPLIKDNDREENILLDYDEKDVYEAYQTTYTSNASRIVTPGDEGYIDGAHGGYLELTPDENNQWSFSTWLFQDYLTISEIDGIVFRMYLSEEFVKNNLVISLGFTDYNSRWISGYWIVNNMQDQTNAWHVGWNEIVIKANELSFSSNGSAMSLFHGIQMSSHPSWGKGGLVCIDEIRKIPLTYLDSDIDFWTCVASFDKEEYINGEDDKPGIASAIENTELSISDVDGANGKALKVVSSAANGEFRLNFGPNNVLTLGNYNESMISGGTIRVYSENTNQLLLVGYGGRDYIDSRFTLNLNAGWNEFDLNYYTNEIGESVTIYGFKCFVKQAGTIYIDNIAKVDNVQLQTAKDGDVVFDTNDYYSKYAIQDCAWHMWGSGITAGYIETTYADGEYKGVAIDYTNLINQETYFKFSVKLNKPVTFNQRIKVKVKLFDECRMFYYFNKSGRTENLGNVGEHEFYIYAANLISDKNAKIDFIYFALASTSNSSRIAIIQEILVENIEQHTVQVEGGSAEGLFFAKTKVYLTVDESAIPAGKVFEKWSINGVFTYDNHFEMPDENVSVVAIYADEIEEDELPEGAILINDYVQPFVPEVEYWGGCYAAINNLSVYEGKGGVLSIKDGDQYTSLTVADLSVLSQDVKDTINANPSKYGITVKLLMRDNVTQIFLGFNGGAGERLYSSESIEYNNWITLCFPLTSNGISDETLFCIFYSDSQGEQVYIDQIYITELPTYAISVTGGTANVDNASCGETITLNLDNDAIPEGELFGYWTVNGEIIEGNSFVMPNQAVIVNAVYVASAYSISVTGGTANADNARYGETVTLNVDNNAIPVGKAFGYWTVNGEKIEGNTFVMPNQAVTVIAVYVTPELAIPEGALLVTDYSSSPSPWNNPNYGHGTVGVVNYYAESQGRAGVVAFGTNQGARSYTQWTAVVPSFDGTGYNKLVVRVKIDTSKCVRAVFDDNDGLSLITAATSNQWGKVELNLSELGACYLTIAADSAGDCIWIDQIYLITLPTYAISVTGGTANMRNASRGEKITLTVDNNAIPVGKAFGYWTVNGEKIEGNSFVMPNQTVTVNAVYITSELSIPEGALLVTDYSTSPSPWNNPNYGHGTVGVVNYYAESQGRAGVVAFGTNQGARSYTQWTAVVPSFDGTGYNKLVVRVKIDTSKCVRAVFDDNDGASLITAATSNQWGEVELNLSDVGSCYLTIATDNAGDCIWIDQIYVKYSEPTAILYDATQITYIHGVGTPASDTFSDWATMGATPDGNAYTHSWGAVGTTYVGAKFNLKLGADTSWLFISFGAYTNSNACIGSGQSGVMLCISAESHKGLLINTSAGFTGITSGYDFSAGGEYLIEVGVLEAGHYYFKVNDVLIQEETDMETSLPGSYLNITSWDANTQIKTALS